uniref:AAA family ATPase n=1 Tax=Gemmatimonas sp. TaxID=1962908 RepID=UPI0035662A8D
EVVAQLRRRLDDAELGATLRVRLPDGRLAIATGADVPQRQVGAILEVAGFWDATRTHRLIFRVQELIAIRRPDVASATTEYLSRNIANLGRKRAARIVQALGRDTLERLIADPTLARPLFTGGTAVAITQALRGWADEQQRDTVARILTTKLTTAGVGYALVRRVLRHFRGSDAAAIVTLRHPYRLLDVHGIGWQTADDIAQRLGVGAHDAVRLIAACQFELSAAPARGHTGLPPRVLADRAARLLQRPADAALHTAVRELHAQGHVTSVGGLLGLPELVAQEAALADRLAGQLALRVARTDAQVTTTAAVLAASPLSSTQRDAVAMACDHGLSVLTGRPGAGKTTTIKTLVACAQALGWRTQIVAPTGKAASRAASVAGVPASTVHRLLSGESQDTPAPLDVDLLIVDEGSMCDIEVALWLMRAVAPERRTRVVWCGDADQLPSVGAGQVLADLIASRVVPTTQLLEVFRQAVESPIIRNAHRLLDHQPVEQTNADGWRFVALQQALATTDQVVLAEVQALLHAGRRVDDIQVLTPMRKGVLGVEHLNRALQDLANAAGAVGPYIGGGSRVRVGDRVVVTRNIYDLPIPLFNGEQGTVVDVERRGIVRVQIGGREVAMTGVHCLMLRLAWAMTVHRAQGSEYPAVVLAYDHRAHFAMLDPRLLYTAITRAREHLTLVGTVEALTETQRRHASSARHTTLAHHLRTLIPHLAKET